MKKIATITTYTMTYPKYTDFYAGKIAKATKTFKTEAEAEDWMVAYANEHEQVVEEAPAEWWKITKRTRKVEID